MGGVFAFADLGAGGLPLLVGGPFAGGVAAFEGFDGEGEDVGAEPTDIASDARLGGVAVPCGYWDRGFVVPDVGRVPGRRLGL